MRGAVVETLKSESKCTRLKPVISWKYEEY